ncbi:DUF1028 domain-containing protein [Devosia sp. Leaf64]|uniref:DUF1028 domain-containing protein n=1 Tax=Devosia sp. Leaf64 TaxID=1736229 RepID=UPI000715D955|nr:DUF1028 domain-containing protein [Devosia sp. Leaf64]KQN72388.1 hypothetical protein ASE94_07700 [Devosia sp. Leaf64]
MTFSIIARDPVSGAFGVATATAGPMVGALVPHVRGGIGAAATQAMTNPYLAIDALALLDGQPADAALASALANDAEADRRQVVLVDAAGRTAGWTGADCIGFAGHVLETNVAVAGNMLTGRAVIENMMAAFRAAERNLARALLDALLAGAAAGGDSRGVGSSALLVQGSQAYPDLDLRVDAADDPLAALDHLLDLATSGSYAEFVAEVLKR